MLLLVSVATAADARAAVEGGAQIVDAKNPDAGALGAVTLARFREIRDAVDDKGPVSAALGDATNEEVVARQARQYAGAGADFVKVGLLGTADAGCAEALLAAAVSGAVDACGGVVAVCYADADAAVALSPRALIPAAARAGARWVLLDTSDKDGPGLLGVMPVPAIADCIAAGHDAGLKVAVAGKLEARDIPVLAGLGADVAGVRGAACVGGRAGCVSADLVRVLRAASQVQAGAP
jgi:uncharacterized protein (UPF0264 family)